MLIYTIKILDISIEEEEVVINRINIDKEVGTTNDSMMASD